MRTHRVTEALENAGRRAGELAMERTQEYYQGGRDSALSFAHSIEECVRSQPIRSILLTVGVVCLITSAFIRR